MSEEEQYSPWQPNKDFYRSNYRSDQIREACIPAVQTVDRLIKDPVVSENPALRTSLYASLEAINGKLIELGITPHMHLDKKLEHFQKDPVLAAEYLASQLIGLTGRKILSETEVRPLIEEYAEEKAGKIRLTGDPLPPNLIDFAAVENTARFIEENFDIEIEGHKDTEQES